MIEGINTPTNTLVIYDKPYSVFSFNNLVGRVGRLNPMNPKPGKIYLLEEDTFCMSKEDEWITLEILYEQEEVLTETPEDESLYLEKEIRVETAKNEFNSFQEKIFEKFGFSYLEVVEEGIEYDVLKNFLFVFEEVLTKRKENEIIDMIAYKIIPGQKNFLSGLKKEKYSAYINSLIKDEYDFISVFPLATLITSTNGIKTTIESFAKKYPRHNTSDINQYIETVFIVNEFIKFNMMKIIPIFDLVNKYRPFDKEKNSAFINTINHLKKVSDTKDGYLKILSDLGFPNEDITLIRNNINTVKDVQGTENKLKEMRNTAITSQISPFGRRIIESL